MFVAPAHLTRALRHAAALASVTLVLIFALPFETAAAKGHAGGGHRSELNCLASAIYFEARGESERGQRAIAEVVLARTKAPDRPHTICGVVYEGAGHGRGCQFSFACDGKSEIARDHESWDRAKGIAADAMESHGRIVKGATFFHLTSVHPRWARHMVRVCRVGTHIFYRPRHEAALYAADDR